MVFISRLASGAILLQKDATELVIDQAAIPSTLPHVIAILTDGARLVGLARHEGYEAGLIQGREQARIEHETALRIADRQADELVAALAVGGLASAA